MSVKVKDVTAPRPRKGRRKGPWWWRVLRGTVRGTGTVIRIAYVETRFTYGVTKTRTRARYNAWKAERTFTADDQPEIDEVPIKRRRLFRPQYLCFACNRKYRSLHGLNKHFERVHGGEPLAKDRDQTEEKIFGRADTGKIRVRPSAGPGRKTAKTRSTRVESTFVQALKNAWGQMREARPYYLSEIRADLVGLEQALGANAAEGINEYRAHLIRNVHLDPVTVHKLMTAIDLLQQAGSQCSAVIAAIDEFYAEDIAAAKKRKGGQRPADKTLAN